MSLPRLIPDWTPTDDVVLVWPEVRRLHAELVPFYVQLIALIQPHANLAIVVRDATMQRSASNVLATLVPTERVRFLHIRTVRDIWIRDWAPVLTKAANGRIVAVKATYRPSYGASASSRGDHQAGIELARQLGISTREIDLAWDLGNLEHDGRGTAIVTSRVLDDNPSVTVREIEALFRDALGIRRLLLIPPEPGDVTGHTDGTLRFLGPHTLAIASYPRSYQRGAHHCDTLADDLADRLGHAYRIVRIPCATPEHNSFEGVPSAAGNYLNFLRLGARTIVLPAYGSSEDATALRALEAAVPACRIVPMSATDLARRGGALHCVTGLILSRPP